MSKKPELKRKEKVKKNKYKEGFIFPCDNKCIVAAACKIYCYKVFNYMNFIADEIITMNADQIAVYRASTPFFIKRKIQEFYTYDKRLAYPETATLRRDWK